MKYVVILGDGMADYPVDAFDGKTILEVADKPTIDYMAQHGEMGMVKTVQDGMKPGSDVANLSVMGYDTKKCYSGRSPLEAASIGVPLKDNDVTFRCNLVTLSDEENYEDKTMLDYSAGEITTEEAAELIKAVAKELDTDTAAFLSSVLKCIKSVIGRSCTITVRIINGEYTTFFTDSVVILHNLYPLLKYALY